MFADTARPMANLPEPIDEPVFSWVITGLDRLMGNSSVVRSEERGCLSSRLRW